MKIELNAKEEALVYYESEWGRNESIKRAARILHYANIGTETMRELCEKTGYDFEMRRDYLSTVKFEVSGMIFRKVYNSFMAILPLA